MSDENLNTNNIDQAENSLDSKLTPLTKSPEKRAFLEINDAEKYKSFMLKQLETKRFKPSSALSKVRDFLPMMKQSNEKLLEDYKENPDQVNIENVDEEDEHIEMNLALVAQSDSDEEESDEEEENDEEEEESGDSSSNSIDDLKLGFKVKDPSKINKLKLEVDTKKRKGLIQVINGSEENIDDEQNEEINN